jgi:hypothetical protein
VSTVINQPSSYQPQSTYPEISFGTKGIPPPSGLYVAREDVGSITSFCAVTGITLEVHGRVLLPNGTVVPFFQAHQPNSNRTLKTDIFAIPEGFLLNIAVFLAAGSAQRGQCYVAVKLGRGQGAARVDHQVILQGYVGNTVNQAWPGNRLEQPTEGPGIIRSITGTTPAAGVGILETVPTGARWRLVAIQATLSTSAAVANRFVEMIVSVNAIAVLTIPVDGVQTASLSWTYNFGTGVAFWTSGLGTQRLFSMPVGFILPAGSTFQVTAVSIQAADQFTAPNYTIEEWIEP